MDSRQSGAVTGPVALTVADLDRVEEFYVRAIGLTALASQRHRVSLGSPDGTVLLELCGDPDAPPAPPGSSGLFHLALLVPDRAELARQVRRLQVAQARLTGVADHLVSEALYLDDPEGNGIEIYRDRPREQWRYVGEDVQMATLALDMAGVMAELPDGALPEAVHPASRIGHVHLHVQDLAAAKRFYVGELGFEVTLRGYRGALFFSRGGYHHHVAVNTWSGAAGAPPRGSRGLLRFQLDGGGTARTDPSGNGIDSGR